MLKIWIVTFLLVVSSVAEAKLEFQLPDISDELPAVKSLLQTGYSELKNNPNSAEKWGRLAAMLYVNDYTAESLALFEKAKALNPEAPMWLTLSGVVNYRMSRIELALENLEKARSLVPGNTVLLLYIGNIYEEYGEYEAALAVYKQAEKVSPLDELAFVHYFLGRVLMNLQRYQKSKLNLLKVTKEFSNSARYRGLLLKLSSLIDLDKSVIPGESEAINQAPISLGVPYGTELSRYRRDEASLHIAFSHAVREQRDFNQALSIIKLIEEFYPESIAESQFIDYGFILSSQGRHKQAGDIYHRALRKYPKSIEANLGVADHAFLNRNYSEAAKFYDTVLNLKPEKSEFLGRAYQGKGRLAAVSKKLNQSLGLLSKASDYWPTSGSIHMDLVRVYADMKKFDKAEMHLSKAEENGISVSPVFREKLKLAQQIHEKRKNTSQ